jgi:hypothetical protein
VQRILREQGLRTVQSVGQGRAVTLPEPSREDVGEAEPEIAAGQAVLKFPSSRSSGTASEGAPGVDHGEETIDVGNGGSRHAAGAVLPGDIADTGSELPSHSPTDRAQEAAVPAWTGLAPQDLDRLKAALQRLEECRRLLDETGNEG